MDWEGIKEDSKKESQERRKSNLEKSILLLEERGIDFKKLSANHR